MTMRFIEAVNDVAMIGLGLLTIEIDIDGLPASRSLLGVFWHKEDREIVLNIIFFELKIS